jgi:predicted permease
MKDVAYAFRSLVRAPGLFAALIGTLALGIGANAAIYSVVATLLFQPPPFRAPDRLALIHANMVVGGLARANLAGPEVIDFQSAATTLQGVAAIAPASAALAGNGDPEQLQIGRVSWNFFDVLGVPAARGRTFAEEDGAPSPAAPVVLGWPLFVRRFGGDAAVVGRRVVLNGTPVTVIGVLPREFRLHFSGDLGIPDGLQLFQPFPTDLASAHRLLRYYRVVARVSDGVTMADAAREVETISADLARRFPHYTPAKHSFYLAPLLEDSAREVRPLLFALTGGVIIVLVACCVNVGGLLMMRTAARRREIATLVALGASRMRLVRQFVAEGLLVAAFGAVAGIGVGYIALQGMVALRPPGLDRIERAAIDTQLLLVIVAIATLLGLLFALASLAEFGRAPASRGLLSAAPAGGRLRYRARSAIVIAQIALGTMLIVSAGLLVRTVEALHHVDAGFDMRTRALTFQLTLPPGRYPNSERVNAFSRELETRLRALPGVEQVGAISHLPFDDRGGNWASKYFSEHSSQDLALARIADTRAVSPGTLSALGIQLVRGRWFTEADDRSSAPVVVVDEQLAARGWPRGAAIGERVHVPFLIDREVTTTWATVIGVVRHIRYRRPDAEVQEQVYFAYRQNLRDSVAYVVRTAADPAMLTTDVRRVVATLDPVLPAYDVQPLDAYVARAMSSRKFTAVLISSFAMLALTLAGGGLAALASYAVASRRREFGIRIALGASPARIHSAVLVEALVLVGAGVALGLLGGTVAANAMRALLFGVGPGDLTSYTNAIVLLFVTGMAASWLPARRAMRVNPVEVLRAE